MKHLMALGVLMAVLPAARFAEAQDHPWPMFGRDLQRTARTPYTGPSKPNALWTFTANDGIASSAAVASDGTVYVGAGWDFRGAKDGSLYAIDAEGSLKWRYATGAAVFSSPSIGKDGTVYAGSLDGHLYAIDDRGGEGVLLWRTLLDHWVYSSPAVMPGGDIIVGGVDFNVYGIAPDGSIRWNHTTEWCVFSSPAVTPDGVIHIGSKDHHLYTFDRTGHLLWQASTGRFYDGHLVDSSPAVGVDGTVYVGTDPYGAMGQEPVPVTTGLFAFNPDGSRKWSFDDMDDGAESSPAIGPDGTIYIGSYDGCLYAIEDTGGAGRLKWKFRTGGAVDGSPAVDGAGTVYFGSRDGYVYALTPEGEVKWRFETGGDIEASPAIDGRGVLYIGSFDGSLHAIGEPGPDTGVVSAEHPAVLETGEALDIEAVIANFRSAPAAPTATLELLSGDSVIHGETLDIPTLSDGGRTTVSFTPVTPGAITADSLTVRVSTAVPGDTNEENDALVSFLRIQTGDTGVEIDERGGTPPGFILKQNSPNPFNAETMISFEITGTGGSHASLTIYDMQGREIITLMDGHLTPGPYSITWDGSDRNGRKAASGTYILNLRYGAANETRKMLHMK